MIVSIGSIDPFRESEVRVSLNARSARPGPMQLPRAAVAFPENGRHVRLPPYVDPKISVIGSSGAKAPTVS
jgi:hypothetical protein